MISIVIPFKYDSINRIENLLELTSYAHKHWEFDQLIVVEMDSKPKINDLLPEWVDYIFAKESQKNWSRSKRINLCIPLIRSKVLAIMDTDLIVDKNCFNLSVEKIIKNEVDAVTPFEKVYHYPRSLILKNMKAGEIKIADFCENNKNFSRVFVANGGCFITKTAIFKHIRGMNELFLGWGLEDDELINRYIKLGYRYGRINKVPAIHINHERTTNCEIDLDNFNNSLIEKNRGLISSREDIIKYFGITEVPGTYSIINKPLPVDTNELKDLVEKEKQLYNNVKKESYEI